MQPQCDVMSKAVHVKLLRGGAEVRIRGVVDVLCEHNVRPVLARHDARDRGLVGVVRHRLACQGEDLPNVAAEDGYES